MITITDALVSLCPNAEFSVENEVYSGITWNSPSISVPTEDAVNAEINRLENAYKNSEYKRNRAKEYPDFKDYLDGVVKGDQAQIDAYISACKAVKEKYPK